MTVRSSILDDPLEKYLGRTLVLVVLLPDQDEYLPFHIIDQQLGWSSDANRTGRHLLVARWAICGLGGAGQG